MKPIATHYPIRQCTKPEDVIEAVHRLYDEHPEVFTVGSWWEWFHPLIDGQMAWYVPDASIQRPAPAEAERDTELADRVCKVCVEGACYLFAADNKVARRAISHLNDIAEREHRPRYKLARSVNDQLGLEGLRDILALAVQEIGT